MSISEMMSFPMPALSPRVSGLRKADWRTKVMARRGFERSSRGTRTALPRDSGHLLPCVCRVPGVPPRTGVTLFSLRNTSKRERVSLCFREEKPEVARSYINCLVRREPEPQSQG